MQPPAASRRSLARALAACALGAAALGPLPLGAQTIVGVVSESGTARPLAGVFIVPIDENGSRGGGVLSGPDGGYVLRPHGTGRYRLVAEMIGYASTTTEWVEVPAGASVRLDISVDIEAVSLDAIEVEAAERCRRRPGSGPETARLWEEARKALEVARWSQAAGILRFHVVEHRRELDARTLRVVAQRQTGKAGYYDRSPYRSIPAERLARGGYIQQAPNGTWDFFAPDAEVLLSESFLESHCFRVAAPPPEEPDLIGLAFEPVPEREVPDIEGVLWLDRGSAELRRLDFSYPRLPFLRGRHDQVGGRVEFERLATGTWIVRRWHIRMPLAARETGGFGGGAREVQLLTLTEEGADVRTVETREGTRIAEAVGATLYGRVFGGGAPDGLGGARVEVLATDALTTTGEDGGFRLSGVPPGTYAVRITHPEIARLGLAPLERTVDLRGGRATRLLVGLDASAARARELCREAGAAGGQGAEPVVVYGVVLAADGATPVPRALLRIWSGGPERRLAADSTGSFRFCVPASAEPVRLAAVQPSALLAGAAGLEVVKVRAAEPGFVAAEVPLSAPAGAPPAYIRSSWSNAIVGRVLEQGTSRPVAGAMVTMTGPGGSAAGGMVTDDAGRFKLLHPGGGHDRFTLRVEHVGFGTVETGVALPPGQEVHLDVLVSPRAIPLDPVVVTGRRHGFLADAGFYERLERGAGIFVQREEIERRRPTRVTDLLHGRSGLRVVRRGGAFDVVPTERVSFRTAPESCRLSIWLDGVLVRAGGPAADSGRTPSAATLLSEVVDPDRVEAMEVYTGPAGMPQQFGGTDSPCGAVVIWTRRP